MHLHSILYPYQSDILAVFESERAKGEKKIHIVAPPGSGKTIIGLEMMCRLDQPTLILVPNLTLQAQWYDKIRTMFIDEHEDIDTLVSMDIHSIKRINIVTYQSLTTSGESDMIHREIMDLWYESERDEFASRDLFDTFVSELRSEDPDEYTTTYNQHRKKLKSSGESTITRALMTDTIKAYVGDLRTAGVQTMIVDEAHHLTSWWSHVLYEIWQDLGRPYIIGLTATPPFEDVDFFELDESYAELLGTVDYYVPTPAIVRSGRLAPYASLLYIVPPDDSLRETLREKETKLQDYLQKHQSEIVTFLHDFLCKNFDTQKTKSLTLLERYIRYVYYHRSADLDMSSYITPHATEPLTLEDIAKSIAKWGYEDFKKSKKSSNLTDIKGLFFDLGYIWRGASLYRFETPMEKGLIYSPSKIQGIKTILTTEIGHLGERLCGAIITDFIDSESDWINGHMILDALGASHPELHPYLVSGQGIWHIEDGQKVLVNENILSITEKLTRGETRLVIGTRGILGEGWDCPAVNTLIDLTGVSAYMSVNQIHGRGIRLDLNHPDKVANIYDIVCLGEGYQGTRDLDRLIRKHAQLYGVDDAGLIIKGLDHLYPQLERLILQKQNTRNETKSEASQKQEVRGTKIFSKGVYGGVNEGEQNFCEKVNFCETEREATLGYKEIRSFSEVSRINTYMLRKSGLRSMIRDLWRVGGEFQNQEVFSLSIEIQRPYEVIPMPSTLSLRRYMRMRAKNWQSDNLLELGNTSYHTIVRMWITELIEACLQVIRSADMIPSDFSYELQHTPSGSITITSGYPDPMVSKRFIEIISSLFGPITDQRYQLNGYTTISEKPINLPDIQPMTLMILLIMFMIGMSLGIGSGVFHPNALNMIFPGLGVLIIIYIAYHSLKERIKKNALKMIKEFGEKNIPTGSIGLPQILVSNEEKRKLFLGKIKLQTTSGAWYYRFIENPLYFMIAGIFAIPLIIATLFLFSINITIILGILCIIVMIGIPITHQIIVYLKNKKLRSLFPAHPVGEITLVEPADIGEPAFLTSKIEKLWI